MHPAARMWHEARPAKSRTSIAVTASASAPAKSIPTTLAAGLRMRPTWRGRVNRTGDKCAIGKTLEFQLRNFLADETLDVADVAGVFRRDEREGIADRLGAPGAADAVDVILGFFGTS